MAEDAPFRRAFDAARDPYTARNALGITSTGGGGSGFITAVTPPLQVTGTTLSIDLSAYSTTAQIAAAYQPLDADLTAIAALTGANTIYYRSAADTWSPVTIGANLTFTGGTLAASGGGGGAPGGSTTQVQYNNAGAFGGSANMTWNNTTSVLTLTGQLVVSVGSATSVLAAGTVEGASFRCAGGIAVLGPALAGVVALRPNGIASTTGQLQVSTTGVTAVTPITLPANPTANLHAATKQYVDLFAPLASPTFTGDPKAPTPTAGDNDTSIATTAFVTAAVAAGGGGGGGGGGFGPPQGRLTLGGSGAPVMIATYTAITAIGYVPYVGDQVPIYNGTIWTMTVLPGGSLSCTLSDTTKNPAAVGASQVLDWFIWSDAGTLRLSHGPAWTSDTTRSAGTAIERINGLWVNSVAITNACAAQRGTYVGTTRSNASATLDWKYGTSAALGGTALLNVWNAYNRVDVGTKVSDSTASWGYGTNVWRASNNSAANRVNFVSGLAEDSPQCSYIQVLNAPSTVGNASLGIGLDSTTVPTFSGSTVSATAFNGTININGAVWPAQLGAHFLQAMEWGGGVNFYGEAEHHVQGLLFRLRM